MLIKNIRAGLTVGLSSVTVLEAVFIINYDGQLIKYRNTLKIKLHNYNFCLNVTLFPSNSH